MQEHLILGGFFAAIIVLLFIRNWRSTLIAAIAIPTSIIGTFLIMALLGRSLNVISLAGLAFAVGMLVDNAIVVLENIFRHLRQGEDPRDAAINGRSEIGLAAISIPLADVVVFLPIAFMGGIVGRMLHEMAFTIVIAILVSGLVSVTLTPMLCSRLLRAEASS